MAGPSQNFNKYKKWTDLEEAGRGEGLNAALKVTENEAEPRDGLQRRFGAPGHWCPAPNERRRLGLLYPRISHSIPTIAGCCRVLCAAGSLLLWGEASQWRLGYIATPRLLDLGTPRVCPSLEGVPVNFERKFF